MRYISEISEQKQPVLIVDPYETRSAHLLERKLKDTGSVDVLLQRDFPARLEHFFLIYVVNADPGPWYDTLKASSRIMFIFIKQSRKAHAQAARVSRANMKHAKVVSINADFLDAHALERILAFSFESKTADPFLEIAVPKKTEEPDPRSSTNVRVRRRFKRHYILFGFLTLLVYSMVAITLLFASSTMYLSMFSKPDKKPGFIVNMRNARGLQGVGRALYRPVRPVFFFFSLGLLPDTLIEMNTQLDALGTTYSQIDENSTLIVRNIFIKQKNAPLKAQLSKQILDLQSEIAKSLELSSILEQKIPRWNTQTEEVRLSVSTKKDSLARLQSVPHLLDSITGKNSRRKYLVLLADTNLAKPGGGTLPFFGVLMMSDMDIQSFDIYDSRSVDQLETSNATDDVPGSREEHPESLQNALSSGDFKENYHRIVTRLQRETGMQGFDGAILITDGGMQQLISAYSPVYLPEIKETLTPDNFLIKYQIADDKKIFMTALMNELQRRAAQTPSNAFVPALITAFNEKQIVFLADDEPTEKVFDDLYWSGIVPTPRCLIQSFVCTSDYIYPLLSNTGDNPVNRFIEKTMTHQITVSDDGHVSDTFTMTVRNTSTAGVFPGGDYHTYMQVIIPASSTLNKVTIDGQEVKDPDIASSAYSIVGFPFDLAAQQTKEINISYALEDLVPKTKSIYQLIIQKQIGSPNSDVALEIVLPLNATITNKNFSPVVKNGRVSYNTVLDADKLFVLEIDNTR